MPKSFSSIWRSKSSSSCLGSEDWKQHALKGQKFQKQHALKGQKLQKQHALKGQKLQKQHALKGQKLLAQGIALGIMADNKAPCKGKSFMSCLEF